METWAYPRDPIDMLVGLSNYDAGFMAASHLAERGYRRVAFMARHGGRGELRRQGFAAAAAHRGLEVVAELAVDNPQTIADGRAALARLLSQGGKFDAVFCANDLLAVGAMFEARDRKLAVPRDLAVLGFGETDIAGEIQRADHHRRGQPGPGPARRRNAAAAPGRRHAGPSSPSDAAAHPRARQRLTPPLRRDGRPPWPGYMLAGPLSHFQNGRKTHARLERPLLLRTGRPERRLRARRPGAGHPKSRLSRRIALLEERLGVRLIQRSTRSFAVTELGQEYYEQCLSMLAGAEAAQEVIDRTHAEPQGTIRLSAPPAQIHYFLGELIARFMVKCPKVQVYLKSFSRPVDVLREGYDLAVRVRFGPIESSDLVMKPLGMSGQRLVAAPALARAVALPADPGALGQLPTLALGIDGRESHWKLDGPDGARLSVPFSPRLVTDDMMALKQAAVQGVGVAALPS